MKHIRGITERCTGAGYVCGFPRRSLRLRFLVFPRSLALVRPPGDLGRYVPTRRYTMSDSNTYQEAFHLGVNALMLCFGNALPDGWLPQIRKRVETSARKLAVPVHVEELCNIGGDVEAFAPHRESITTHLRSSSERSANCFELGVTMMGTVFGRDFALQTGEFENLFVATLKKQAKAAGVDWSLFAEFVASLENPQVDGNEVVANVFPEAAAAVEHALATAPDSTNRNRTSPSPTSHDILSLIARLVAGLGAILLVGGVVVAVVGRSSDTTFKLIGQEFSFTSVGVALAFIGTVMVVFTFRRVLASLVSAHQNQG